MTEGRNWDFPIQCVAALCVVGIAAAAPLNYTARERRMKICGVVILLFVGFLFSLRNFFESRKKSGFTTTTSQGYGEAGIWIKST